MDNQILRKKEFFTKLFLKKIRVKNEEKKERITFLKEFNIKINVLC